MSVFGAGETALWPLKTPGTETPAQIELFHHLIIQETFCQMWRVKLGTCLPANQPQQDQHLCWRKTKKQSPSRSYFDVCFTQGLWQILPLSARSSYLGKSQLSGWVDVSYISMMPLLLHQRAALVYVGSIHSGSGAAAPEGNWQARAPCLVPSPGGQLGCLCCPQLRENA